MRQCGCAGAGREDRQSLIREAHNVSWTQEAAIPTARTELTSGFAIAAVQQARCAVLEQHLEQVRDADVYLDDCADEQRQERHEDHALAQVSVDALTEVRVGRGAHLL